MGKAKKHLQKLCGECGGSLVKTRRQVSQGNVVMYETWFVCNDCGDEKEFVDKKREFVKMVYDEE